VQRNDSQHLVADHPIHQCFVKNQLSTAE